MQSGNTGLVSERERRKGIIPTHLCQFEELRATLLEPENPKFYVLTVALGL